jgi:hypothetical protein
LTAYWGKPFFSVSVFDVPGSLLLLPLRPSLKAHGIAAYRTSRRGSGPEKVPSASGRQPKALRGPDEARVRDYIENGGLISYGPNYQDLSGSAAEFVDKILRRAKASDIRAEQPTKIDLVVNLITANPLSASPCRNRCPAAPTK